ncbi:MULTISPECIES: signal peptidase II [Brevibacterium]|uniref:Lipoprotein signal peptidase n=4 Tax=Brevibacterium TaxID=1696 RepID=A0A144MEH5_BRELN|nr:MULTISPECIES: signal peptidase II [Brevibacterium]MDN5551977.1 signal peptidase II [Brevibacterium sp.]AMT94948.1 signal peptidase II [Brevibacterium linens]MDN5773513.1 signal peptidase II [Brevibacterium aurantiacum]MDN5793164.1 signal peptidase II [Brevibacterium aurantiacum]PCC52688.1 signal peptidase II [Brevibacterium aurantiacum]
MTPDATSDIEPASVEPPQRGRWRLTAASLLLALVVVLIDQGTKAWAQATLIEGERIPLVGDLLGLQLAYNPGAAFSFGEGFTWVFALVAVAVAIAALVFAFRVRRPGWAVGIGALGGAAASHAGDRLFRQPGFAQGHVVDFLAYGNWFIGNIADIVIVIVAVAGTLFMIRDDQN